MPPAPMVWSIRVEGDPRPQGRPRFFPGGVIHSPKTDFYRAVFWNAKANKPRIPFDGPLALDVAFIFPCPKCRRPGEWKTSKGDLDNLLKVVADAMTKAGVWIDDCLVCDSHESKKYAGVGEAPGALIAVRRL